MSPREDAVMSTIVQPMPTTLPSAADVYRFTVEKYDQMVRNGTIDEDDPVELLDGIAVADLLPRPTGP